MVIDIILLIAATLTLVGLSLCVLFIFLPVIVPAVILIIFGMVLAEFLRGEKDERETDRSSDPKTP